MIVSSIDIRFYCSTLHRIVDEARKNFRGNILELFIKLYLVRHQPGGNDKERERESFDGASLLRNQDQIYREHEAQFDISNSIIKLICSLHFETLSIPLN